MSLSSGVLMLGSDSRAASPANTSELSQTRIRAGRRVVQKKRVTHELAKHELAKHDSGQYTKARKCAVESGCSSVEQLS